MKSDKKIRNPRICIIRQYYFPMDGHVRRNVEALRDNGYDVDVICARAKGERFTEEWRGVRIYRIPVSHIRASLLRHLFEYLSFFVISAPLLSCLYVRRHYAAVEVDNWPDFLVFVAMIPKLFGAKVVLYMFESTTQILSQKYPLRRAAFVSRIFILMEKWSLRFADRVIATHVYAKESFRRHGLPDSKVTVVLNVPDESIFHKSKASASSSDEHNDSQTVFRLFTHSTLTRVYGVQTAIKSLKTVSFKIAGARLQIVGDWEYKQELVQLTNELGLTDRVGFTGLVPIEQIPGLISGADIGVISILIEYALPLKLFEYAAMRVPVVCSDFMTVRKYFPSTAVLYFEPGNSEDLAEKIIYLHGHPAEGRRMVEKAYEVYEEYRWTKMKANYIGAFQ